MDNTPIDRIYGAQVTFRYRYLHDPENLVMRPATWEGIASGIDGYALVPRQEGGDKWVMSLWGIPVKEDNSIPPNEVHIVGGGKVIKLLLREE